MKAEIFRNLLLPLLFVGILGFAWREVQLTREAMANLGVAQVCRSDLDAQLVKAKGRLAETSRLYSSLIARRAMLEAAKKRITTYEGDLKILAEVARPWREIVLQRDRKLQAMYLQSERIALERRYAPFVSAQGLSQEQARKLEAEDVANAERVLDIKASAQAQGLEDSDPAVVALLNESNGQFDAALEKLLGDEGFSQFQDYQRTLPTREFVNTLAGELAFTDSPLNAQQANQLVEELSAANSSYQSGGLAVSPRLQDYRQLMATQGLAQESVAWDSIESQVQGQLSNTQFSLLDSMMRDNSSTIQLYNMMEQSSQAPLLGFSYSRKTH